MLQTPARAGVIRVSLFKFFFFAAGMNPCGVLAQEVHSDVLAPVSPLSLSYSAAWRSADQPPATPQADAARSPAASSQAPAPPADPAVPLEPSKATLDFGRPGRWWLTLGGGVAHDFEKDYDLNLHVTFSTFIATELEFAVELGGWYFIQEGTDTGGINPNMVFRWHFLHDDSFNWSMYGDVGIGLLASFDDVPDGGTGFNFTPRAGLGFTHRLDNQGTRLQLGVRYHHISNGRVEGDGRNPSRDSIMAYVGIIFPL